MRKHLTVVSVTMIFGLGLATVTMAADPRVGTWKLNLAQSKLPPSTGAAIKEETAVVREVGDQFETAFTSTRTDSSTTTNKFTEPQKGGAIGRQPAYPEGESGVATMIGPGNWYVTFLQNGKQVRVYHNVISKDGKTMRETYRGTDAKGKPIEGSAVFDKQ